MMNASKLVSSLAMLLLISVYSFAQCDSLFLGNDLFVCPGTTIELDAGEGYLSYAWSDGSTEQTISITEAGTYWCTVVMIDSTNIVINGDFSSGYVGFASDLTQNPVSVYVEGTYAVTTSPSLVHPDFAGCEDHTTGNGNMMVVNGAPFPDQNVWFESMPVTPNTDYHYSGWFTSVHYDNPAILELSINGSPIAQVSLTNTTCLWQNFYAVWNSGINTSIDLQIVNQNIVLNGNDFAIDDINLFEVCTVTDTIHIEFAPEPIVNLGADTVLCEGEAMLLQAGTSFMGYLWQDGSQDPIFLVSEPGLYWVEVINEFGCMGYDTIQVDFSPSPEIDIGNDTTLCNGQSLTLSAGIGYSFYLWQDNSTNPAYEVTEPGTYWVTVQNEFGCQSGDTISVSIASIPNISLGDDDSYCDGEQVVLTPGPGFQSYIWQDNSTTASYTVTQTGIYWVSVSNACGVDSDTISIVFNPSPYPDIGNDTVICQDQTLIIEPATSYTTYYWQDGSTLPFYTVYGAGLYTLEVTNTYGCPNSDEIFVDVSIPQIDLGDDSFECEGDTVILNAGPGFESYLWQDGSSGQTKLITTSGFYNVSIIDQYQCTAADSVNIYFVAQPIVDLGVDQSLCLGDTIIIYAPEGFYTYYWNGQPGGDSIAITEVGYYSLTVVSPCDSLTDEIYISGIEIPQVDLGPDQLGVPGESFSLNAGDGYDSYLWQNGFNEQILEVTPGTDTPENDIYYVEVAIGNCKSADSVKIEFLEVWVPIVITPNGDGSNDIFKPDPERWYAVQNHHMMVFNRWGEKVWESDDFESGWDGTQNGKVVSEGTYFWILELYYDSDNSKKVIRGSLTVMGEKK